MTTPDHRPYLTATDLRTPEDVLAWLDAMALTSSERIAPIQWSMAMAHARLRAHLDRERRQACRRAALVYIARARHHHESAREWAESEPDASFTRAMLDEWAEVARACFRDAITRAITFRAAAREP